MADGINLKNRDPHELNDYLLVKFHDIFGEADDTYSFDCIWFYTAEWYTCMKDFCYTVITMLCSMCIAIMWGCNFGVIVCEHVWFFTPLLRAYTICMGNFQKCNGIIWNCCCAPFVATFGLFLSNIYVKKI